LVDLIKYAFVAGEISPKLFGRTDLEKYDLGLAEATNWFVDYQGGISTRPGTRFIDVVQHDDAETKFFPFKFAPNVSSTYVILFGEGYIRFIQDGAYILEAAKTITGLTQADPGVVTATAHGYNDGDLVRIFDVVGMTQVNQRTFVVANKTTDTFELTNVWGDDIDTSDFTAYASGGTVQRVYTVASPYATADLELLRGYQSRSTVTFTHADYKTHILTRTNDTSWSLAEQEYGVTLSPPTGLALTASASGSAGVGFCVTSVNIDGVESIASDYKFIENSVNYTTTAGQVKLTWTPVAGAVQYRVYRTQVLPTGTDVTRAMQMGFVGTAFGPEFIDNNIIPDFVITPPDRRNPFADGGVEYIDVTAGGTGYTKASTVSITTSTGSGFAGYPVVNSAGTLLHIVVTKQGESYDPADTVVVSGGSAATFTLHLTEATGNNPRVSAVFQQRQVYAATENEPLTVFGSKPDQFANFDVSQIVKEDDSYEFEIDSDEVAPILHMLATRSGLVLWSQAGIWQLTGGQGVAVTPTNALADPQSYTGCSTLPPLPVDTDVVYVEGKGATVRLLSYNDYSKVFASQDLSILSNHLTDPLKPIKYWSFASDPFKLVHAVRSDGVMLNLTLVKEQNVYGWATVKTKGLFKDVLALQENRTDTVYLMVQRRIGGRYVKYIEQFARRDFIEVEDAWCVDAGLANTYTYPSATLTAAAATGDGITFTASSGVFVLGDVGKIIRVGGGKAVIVGYTSSTVVTCDFIKDITNVLPEDEDNTPLPALAGEWTMDTPVTTVSGLWHLEGQSVSILADGNVLPRRTVVNGSVTLDAPATRIIIGLGYRCVAKTLPPTSTEAVIESKRKRIVAILTRLYQSRGLKEGTSLTNLKEMKERTDEPYGQPTRLQEGMKSLTVAGRYTREAQAYFVQDNPLPASILGFVTEMDVGDVTSSGS
jgi:hypothetical protein